MLLTAIGINPEQFLISKEKSIILCEVVFKISLFYESQDLWKCYLFLYFLLGISNGENHIKIG